MNEPIESGKKLAGDFEGLIEQYKNIIRMLVSGLDANTPQEDRDAMAKSVEPIIKNK